MSKTMIKDFKNISLMVNKDPSFVIVAVSKGTAFSCFKVDTKDLVLVFRQVLVSDSTSIVKDISSTSHEIVANSSRRVVYLDGARMSLDEALEMSEFLSGLINLIDKKNKK